MGGWNCIRTLSTSASVLGSGQRHRSELSLQRELRNNGKLHPKGQGLRKKATQNARTLNRLPVVSLDANSPGEDVTLKQDNVL